MDYFKRTWIIAFREHHQLASAKIAYRARESRTQHLFPHSIIFRIEKYRPSVKGYAVTDSCEVRRQHRDCSTLVANMIVNVIDLFSSNYIGRK
jgi:hypothetical protein